ncbi:MAG: orotidine 5'-phosphate decarboxylase / HUMPS family protein, partial [Fervidicoccaceae archaeon]
TSWGSGRRSSRILELAREGPLLQVALDLTDRARALSLARALADLEGVIIELGTPLIKAHGVRIAIELRNESPETILLADTKTSDAGALEARLAFESGADVMTVLGAAGDATVAEAVRVAGELGGLVEVDLINVRDPIGRAVEALELGAHIVGLHVGVDEQRARGARVIDFIDLVRELKARVGERALVSVAGGVRLSDAEKLARAGADIVVMGSTIVGASDPLEVTREALNLLRAVERRRST